MSWHLEIRANGVSGLVHPLIYGHPSPLAFLGWAQAIQRQAWAVGFGPSPAAAELPDVLAQVQLAIGVRACQLRGNAGARLDGRQVPGWTFPRRRSTEQALSESGTAMGDDPRLDGHWHLLVDFAPDFQAALLADPIQCQAFTHWLESQRLLRPFAGSMPQADGTTSVSWIQNRAAEQQALAACWVMDEVPPAPGQSANLADWINGIQASPFRSRARMPTVLGYQLLEAPLANRRGARQHLRHAYADAIVDVVGFAARDTPAWPRWRLATRLSHGSQPGWVRATTAPLASAPTASPYDDL